ncbi:MAG: hypothetical protein KBA03_07125 [Anaerolineaceae bacterium]|nr:hypothetical protein [Anaerolineaceae bacterium]
MTATSWILEGLKPKKRAKKNNIARKDAEIEQIEEPVRLNFDTQRIFSNSRPEPVSQIMLNASETQALSFQATVQIPVKSGVNNASVGNSSAQRNLFDQLENGETLMNNVGKKDFLKIQTTMMLAISFMGLIIGICIAFLI